MNKELSITLRVDAKTGQVTAVKNSFDDLDRKVSSTAKNTDSLKNKLMGIAGAVTVVYGVAKAFHFAVEQTADFLATAARVETLGSTLKRLEGNSAAAQKSMNWIKEFAATTPFQLGEVTDAFIKMRASGIDPTNGLLTTLGDAASAMGKDVGQAVEAIADAITGKNERLKEFGIKASKSGETIAYAWADSSGKSRNIVIQNNKEIIQSTLSAIWNEKYAGSMAEQAKTWNGIISNIQDRWTIFQNDVMSEGLLTYFKAMAMTVGDMMGTAFGSAKESSKGFSDYVIFGIKTVIGAVGDMADIWSGVSATYAAVKVAFFSLVVGIGEGINKMGVGWSAYTTGAQNLFKAFVDAIGTAWVATVNFMLEKLNSFLSAMAGLGNDVLGFFGMEGIKPLSFQLGTYTSVIKTAKQDTSDLINLDWANSNLDKSIKDLGTSMDAIINEDGSKAAANAIANIDKNMATLTKTEEANNKVKEDANKYLIEHGAAYGDLAKQAEKHAKAAKKAGTAATKAATDTAKAYKNMIRDMSEDIDFSLFGTTGAEDQANKFADAFSSAFQGVLGGDVFSAFTSFFNNISTQLVKPFIDQISEKLSSMLNSMIGGLGTFGSALLGVGLASAMSVISKFTASHISASDLKSAQGVTTVLSDSVMNSIDTITKNSTKGLDYSEQMVQSLKSLVYLTDQAASNIGSDLTGSNYVNSTDYGFFNDTTKELVSVGIKLNPATIDQLNAGALSASKYMTEKVTDSGFLGIGAGESLKTTNLGEADSSILEPINAAYLEGIDTVRLAAEALGVSAAEFTVTADSWTTSVNQLNFAGKSQAEIAEMINGAIGADLDTLAGSLAAVVPYLEQYTQAGEGQSETLVRLANEYEVVGREMDNLGVVLPGVAEGGLAVADAMVKASGGMDTFLANMNSFIANFYTDAEQAAMMGNTLTKSLSAIGLALPQTAYGFRAMVEGLAATSISSQQAATNLYNMASAAAFAGDATLAASYEMRAAAAQVMADAAAAQYASALALSSDAAKYYDSIGASISDLGISAGGCSASIKDLEDSLASLTDIAGLQEDWIDDSVAASKAYLEAVISDTKLAGISYENFLEKFTEAAANGLTSDELSDWSALSSALRDLHDAVDAARELLVTNEDVLGLQSKWISDEDAARKQLELTIATTGIVGVTYQNFLEKFNEAIIAVNGEMTDEDLANWERLSDALILVNDTIKPLVTTLDSLTLAAQYAAQASSFAMEQMKISGKYDAGVYQAAIDASGMMLEAAHQATGIYGVTSENYLEKFAQANASGLTDEQLQAWKDLGDALLDVDRAYANAMDAYEKELKAIEDLISSLDSLSSQLHTKIEFYLNGAIDTVTNEDIQNLIGEINSTSDVDTLEDLTRESISMIDEYYNQQTAIFTTLLDALDQIQNFVDDTRMEGMNEQTALNTYKFYLDRVQTALASLDSEHIAELVGMLTKSASSYLEISKTTAANTAEYEYQKNVMLNEMEGMAAQKDPFVEAIENLQLQVVTWLKEIDAHIQAIKINISNTPPPAPPQMPVIQDPVTQAYNQYLGRDPDAASLAYWTNEINTPGGVTVDNLGESIAAAAVVSGEKTREWFVRLLYTEGFGRVGTAAEISYWTNDTMPVTVMPDHFAAVDPSYHHFADGGIVTRPTRALIGEAGYPEAVIPLKNPSDPLGNEKLIRTIKEEMTVLKNEIRALREISQRVEDNTRQKRITA